MKKKIERRLRFHYLILKMRKEITIIVYCVQIEWNGKEATGNTTANNMVIEINKLLRLKQDLHIS